MKKFLFAAFIILITSSPCFSKEKSVEPGATLHNSMNSLDWSGTYEGIFPCANCKGILTQITLNKDLSYSYKRAYLGTKKSPVQITGTFVWQPDGKSIRLTNNPRGHNLYRVGEGALIRLNARGKVISSKHRLEKMQDALTETYWKLTELNGQPIKPSEERIREIHLILKNEDNRVSGSGGCNMIMGGYVLDGKNLTFQQMASTMMACEDMKTEGVFLKMLTEVTTFNHSKGSLSFYDVSGKRIAVFQAIHLK